MNQTNQYPFGPLPTRNYIVAEAGTPAQVREKVRERLEQLAEQAARKREAFHTDAAGSPSESLCSPQHLANILAARDEEEARKLRAVKRSQR
jgi:hypothetical protein